MGTEVRRLCIYEPTPTVGQRDAGDVRPMDESLRRLNDGYSVLGPLNKTRA